jgi:nicotinamide phosphoribosyltransferase
MNVWYPTTVATLSYELKKLLVNRLKETGCEIGQADFMLHNFGMRSCALVEAGAVGSMAHLTAFKGTDTVSALPVTMNTYNVKDVPGYSVFATEHSIMTQLGEDDEMDVVENILDNVPDDALISIVIDSYDYKQFLIKFYNRFAKRIMNRKGRVVFRPDSGDPPEVALDCVRTLAEMYGFTTNDKGFNTLDPHVRVLYGDGINLDSIAKILDKLQEYRYSAENLVFGMGGALVNGVTRDTQRFAFKCSARFAGNEWHDVKKKPIDESKASKPGRLRLIKEGGKFVTVKIDDPREGDYLVTVFKNGKLIENYNFDDIRVMVNNQIINEGR